MSKCPVGYENFNKVIHEGLQKGKYRLKKYNKLTLIFSGFTVPVGIKEGFLEFFEDFNFDNEVITEFKNRTIEKGEVYIIPNDRGLVSVIEKSKSQKLKFGKDFGIISYNWMKLLQIF